MRILTGQTASGKSAVAICVARAAGAEIISMDAMKVYRGLDIGTAKPPLEVRETVSFHMIDVADPDQTFSLAAYLKGARLALADIASRGRRAMFVGGTPLYLRGLLYGIFEGPGADWSLRAELIAKAARHGSPALHDELRQVDPAAAARLHPNDLKRIVRALEVARATGRPISEHQRQYPAPRPTASYRLVALRRQEADLKERIARRIDRMFAAGLVDEVKRILEGAGFNRSAAKAIGYREVIEYLTGATTLSEAIERAKRNTWRLARKQRAWLKSFPGVVWLDVARHEPPEETARRVQELLFGKPEQRN